MSIEYLTYELCRKLVDDYSMSYLYLSVERIKYIMGVSWNTADEIHRKLRELGIVDETNSINYDKVETYLKNSSYYYYR